MRISHILRLTIAAGLGATALNMVGLTAPAQAKVADASATCLHPDTNTEIAGARGGPRGTDHRGISLAEERAIERQTNQRLAAKGVSASRAVATKRIPVYFHVMRDAKGHGNVTNTQIHRQVTVLNRDYSRLGFSFALRGISRHNNTAWHHDRKSLHYRAITRRGGANALNIWLVDFTYLGIATFPWDYRKHRAVDGIRVHFDSLPGGSIIHFNLGGTATHETGHWLGLYHTFQGGCTNTNDQVSDTPAESTPTTGCPATRDSCPANGTDPIHNYMDYSWDSCYEEFTAGQAARAHKMWAAYRA